VLSNIEQIPCLNGNDDSFKAQEPPPHADQWLDQKPGSRRVLIKPTAWRAHRRADAWAAEHVRNSMLDSGQRTNRDEILITNRSEAAA